MSLKSMEKKLQSLQFGDQRCMCFQTGRQLYAIGWYEFMPNQLSGNSYPEQNWTWEVFTNQTNTEMQQVADEQMNKVLLQT